MESLEPLINAIRLKTTEYSTMLPPGAKILPEELFAGTPHVARGAVNIESLVSLTDYVLSHAMVSAPTIFASLAILEITAVLDWHKGVEDLAQWGEHTATYALGYTEEIKAWSAINGKTLTQHAFAEFVEEHLEDILKPSAADVLTVVTTISGKRKVEFTNVIALGNGDKSLQWTETTDAKGAGDIRVPGEIMIRIPIYKGCEAVTTFDIRALFRYRITDGRLGFEVRLMHLDKIRSLAFDQVLAGLRAGLGTFPVPIIAGLVSRTPRQVLENQIIKN